jgi:hypothetical protein
MNHIINRGTFLQVAVHNASVAFRVDPHHWTGRVGADALELRD